MVSRVIFAGFRGAHGRASFHGQAAGAAGQPAQRRTEKDGTVLVCFNCTPFLCPCKAVAQGRAGQGGGLTAAAAAPGAAAPCTVSGAGGRVPGVVQAAAPAAMPRRRQSASGRLPVHPAGHAGQHGVDPPPRWRPASPAAPGAYQASSPCTKQAPCPPIEMQARPTPCRVSARPISGQLRRIIGGLDAEILAQLKGVGLDHVGCGLHRPGKQRAVGVGQHLCARGVQRAGQVAVDVRRTPGPALPASTNSTSGPAWPSRVRLSARMCSGSAAGPGSFSSVRAPSGSTSLEVGAGSRRGRGDKIGRDMSARPGAQRLDHRPPGLPGGEPAGDAVLPQRRQHFGDVDPLAAHVPFPPAPAGSARGGTARRCGRSCRWRG